MIEFKGKDSEKVYEPYDKVIKTKCSHISKEISTEMISKLPFDIERYLCPCGIVKIIKGPGYRRKLESDVCGFK